MPSICTRLLTLRQCLSTWTVAVVLVATPTALATTYHIDSRGGSDCADGISQKTPWATFQNLESKNLFPGDRIHLKRGSEWHGQLDVRGEGTAIDPIVVEAYGIGPAPVINGAVRIPKWHWAGGTQDKPIYRASIDGRAPWGVWDGETGYAEAETRSGVTSGSGAFYFDKDSSNLFVAPLPGSDPGELLVNRISFAIATHSRRHVTIRGLEIKHATSGIFVRRSDYVLIEDCHLHHNSYAGVEANYSSYSMIRYSRITDNGQARGGTGITINGITTAQGWLIERNEVLDNGGNGLETYERRSWGGGIELAHGTRDSVVSHNRVRCDPGLQLASDIGIDLESGHPRNNQVHYNVVSGCKYGIMLSNAVNNKIHNNTIYDVVDALTENNGAGGIALHFGAVSNSVKNNIIHIERELSVGSPAVGISVANDSRQGAEIDHNLYYMPRATNQVGRWGNKTYDFKQWCSASGSDHHGLYADPVLKMEGNAEVQPALNSPATNRGANVGLLEDYFGNNLPADGPVSIGAVQPAPVYSCSQ